MKTAKNQIGNQKELHVDLETYCDLDLKEVGVYRYVDHPSFEILLIAYAFDDGEVQIIDLAQGETVPPPVLLALTDPDIIKVAHNANFERTCLSKEYGFMDPSQWRCTAVRATTLGLPRSLDAVGKVLGLGEDEKKSRIGKSLITFFCKPCKATIKNCGRTRNLPKHDLEKWNLFKFYNIQDVIAERAIDRKMSAFPAVLPSEQELWAIDQLMNDRGVKVEMTLVNNILEYYEEYTTRLIRRAQELTGLDNPGSNIQIKQYLAARGIGAESVDKEHVSDLIKELQNDNCINSHKAEILEFLRIRQELGKTSVSKYDAMARSVCDDGRIRGMLQFYGASRTGRWAGRIVQLHNLPRNKLSDIDYARGLVMTHDIDILEMLYGSPLEVFSQLIRTAFVAENNNTFVVADYSAIEARVISWLAGEKWRQEVFANNGDIYCASASKMFKVPVEKHGVNGHLRSKGKIAELALGYQGSKGALMAMGAGEMGLTDAEIDELVSQWRSSNPHIVDLWKKTEAAAMDAIRSPGSIQRVTKGVAFRMHKGSLFCRLPSGRCIVYYEAKLRNVRNRTSIIYQGTAQETQRWEHIETYGGKLVENITQAIARDCLGETMLRLNDAGLLPSFHVHDEVVVEVKKKDLAKVEEHIKEIMQLKEVEWTDGLILNADSYHTPYYKKD